METKFKTKEDKAKEVLNCKELSDDLKVELIGLLMNQPNYATATLGQLWVPNEPKSRPLDNIVYTSSPARPVATTGTCTGITNNATPTV